MTDPNPSVPSPAPTRKLGLYEKIVRYERERYSRPLRGKADELARRLAEVPSWWRRPLAFVRWVLLVNLELAVLAAVLVVPAVVFGVAGFAYLFDKDVLIGLAVLAIAFSSIFAGCALYFAWLIRHASVVRWCASLKRMEEALAAPSDGDCARMFLEWRLRETCPATLFCASFDREDADALWAALNQRARRFCMFLPGDIMEKVRDWDDGAKALFAQLDPVRAGVRDLAAELKRRLDAKTVPVADPEQREIDAVTWAAFFGIVGRAQRLWEKVCVQEVGKEVAIEQFLVSHEWQELKRLLPEFREVILGRP